MIQYFNISFILYTYTNPDSLINMISFLDIDYYLQS
jgi:hypothetical protein